MRQRDDVGLVHAAQLGEPLLEVGPVPQTDAPAARRSRSRASCSEDKALLRPLGGRADTCARSTTA